MDEEHLESRLIFMVGGVPNKECETKDDTALMLATSVGILSSPVGVDGINPKRHLKMSPDTQVAQSRFKTQQIGQAC